MSTCVSRSPKKWQMIGTSTRTTSSRKRMLLVFGSTIALVASLAAFTKSRTYWMVFAGKIILEIKYNLLGMRENIMDIVRAKYNKTELPCKTGCVAIVTGGSRGIGAAVVKMLLQCDMDVIIGCRRIEAGKKAIKQIRKSDITKGTARVYELDNTSLESVKQFAEAVKHDFEKVDVLINNAGIMFTPYGETREGFEQQWGVNYLSHFLLTALLMPLLRNAGTSENFSRVINVSSCAHLLGTINFDDINYNKNQPFLSNGAYAQSKLAQVVFTRTLQQICDEKNLPIQTFAVHPGIVNTDLFEHTVLYKFNWLMSLFFKTPEKGATTTIFAAVNKSIEGRGGLYLSNCLECSVNPMADDKSTREKLLELSLEQAKLKNFCQYL